MTVTPRRVPATSSVIITKPNAPTVKAFAGIGFVGGTFALTLSRSPPPTHKATPALQVAVGKGVALGGTVALAVIVAVSVAVFVGVGVSVGVAVIVAVAVIVGVGEAVAVGASVGVFAGTRVSVAKGGNAIACGSEL